MLQGGGSGENELDDVLKKIALLKNSNDPRYFTDDGNPTTVYFQLLSEFALKDIPPGDIPNITVPVAGGKEIGLDKLLGALRGSQPKELNLEFLLKFSKIKIELGR